MELIEGTYKSEDGKDYYELALNLQNGEKILIKNASCTAVAMDMALKHWELHSSSFNTENVKVFFLGSEPELISEKIPKKIPKKYRRIVFSNKL